MVLVAFPAQLGEDLGQVEPELVGRRVLASVETALAAMTEVGEMHEVPIGEGAVQFHGGEDRAVAFAVAAGVADLHGAAGLLERSALEAAGQTYERDGLFSD
jgi:hypothetical protein